MNNNTVYLWLKNPYQPLFSDKCLFYLAGTFVASGYKLKAVTAPPVLESGDILLTNLTISEKYFPSDSAVLCLTSPTDRIIRLKNVLGYFHGKSRFYHTSMISGENTFLRVAIDFLKKSFQSSYCPAELPEKGAAEAGGTTIHSGRRIVFRVNVDWDEEGFSLLERWCDIYSLRPTLAIAGKEIDGRQERVKSLVERFGLDVASHSLSHYVVLSSQSRQRQYREISGNHSLLENLLSKSVTGFVAPYMKYNRDTFELLEEAGYRWFIRSWSIAPLPLAGFSLIDLGTCFFFSPGWKTGIVERLAISDLVVQLHLRDLIPLADHADWLFKGLALRGVRFVDCETYYKEACSGGSA